MNVKLLENLAPTGIFTLERDPETLFLLPSNLLPTLPPAPVTVFDLTLAKTQSDETPFQGVGVWGDSPAGGSRAATEMSTSTEVAKVSCA